MPGVISAAAVALPETGYARGVSERRAADDEPVRLTDARAIRALAHPARLAVLDALNHGQTLTATEAADIAGLSPSAMSYHLRALAKWGIVREAETGEATDGRERRWERAGAGLQFDPPPRGAEAATTFIAMHYLDETRSQLSRWLGNQQHEADFWRENAVLAYRETWLTEEQAVEMARIAARMVEERKPYQDERPPGARRVRVTFLMFPVDEP
jgi:DNA-binding transcriptional ArsR family regulator